MVIFRILDFYYLCLKESFASFGVLLMKTPMEHYLGDSCPVLHFTATNFQEPGCHVICHR